MLTAGVDVQEDRLECEAVACAHYKAGRSSIVCSTAIQSSRVSGWSLTTQKTYQHESGTALSIVPVALTAVTTPTLYEFASRAFPQNLPVKGAGETVSR